jgi:HD-like signal output (HDOD) protein
VSSPDEAVSYLGLATIRSLVLAVNAFAPFDRHVNGPISFESLWSHSLEVAGLARQIAALEGAPPKDEAEAFIAGMLHDVGKLALSANVPDEYAAVLRSSREGESPLFEAEAVAFGADHGAIGGYLLNLWGLPESVVSGIFFHHNPAQAGPSAPVTVLAVHAANAVAHHRNNAVGVDQSFISSAGLSHRFEEWKQLKP